MLLSFKNIVVAYLPNTPNYSKPNYLPNQFPIFWTTHPNMMKKMIRWLNRHNTIKAQSLITVRPNQECYPTREEYMRTRFSQLLTKSTIQVASLRNNSALRHFSFVWILFWMNLHLKALTFDGIRLDHKHENISIVGCSCCWRAES